MNILELFNNKNKNNRKLISKDLKRRMRGFIDDFRFMLSEDEVRELREGLKAKWIEVNKKYQLLTHKAILDTIGQRRR